MHLSNEALELEASGSHARNSVCYHGVQFYDQDEFLFDVVTRFVREGLVSGEPAVIIATSEHRKGFLKGLTASGIDVSACTRSGMLTLLDARETLSTFLNGGPPDAVRFKTVIAGVLQQAIRATKQTTVRAYGEMVDLLWRDGRQVVAVQVEELWNELATTHSFSLLCAYAMGNFYEEKHTAAFDRICRHHTEVKPTERYFRIAGDDARDREVTLLQQRALVLETELERRKELEQALRAAFTLRREAEEKLRQSEQELKDFLENAVEGLHWVGPDGNILWANRAELDLLGYQSEEYIGHHIREFHVDPDLIDHVLARLARNESLREYEAALRAKDGSVKHVLINSNVLWRDGKFIHTRCFTRDITERKQAEELQKQAVLEAERANRVKTEFLAVMSHELRTPLNAILGYEQIISEGLSGPLTEKQRQQLSRIHLSALHLLALIDDVLDLSRIEAGVTQFELEPVFIASVVDEVSNIIEPQLTAKHLAYEIIVDQSATVVADRSKLGQILINLLNNAIKFTPEGGHITVRTRTRAEVSDRWFLQVSDTGVGIPRSQHENVFEPFVQVQSAYTRQVSGAGLGLAISRKLARGMNADLRVRSELGEGAVFTIDLPRADNR